MSNTPILYINSVGIRNGEYITSHPDAKQNDGTIIQVFLDKPYPVAQEYKLSIKYYREVRFFETMSTKSIEEWLELNTTDNEDIYLEDWPMSVKFIKISGSYFNEMLTPEQMSLLISKKHTIKEVFNMIPRKPGSKAQKHTLIFRPSNWIIYQENKAPKDAVIVNLDDLTVLKDNSQKFTINDLNNIYVTTSEYRSDSLNKDIMTKNMIVVLKQQKLYNSNTEKQLNQLYDIIDWFTPALHKSLIQKLIRTKCETVVYDNNNYPVEYVLLVSISLLTIDVGSFVPTIQRFVTGLESITKRLAVSIIEDSYISNIDDILLLFGCALLSQTKISWVPTDKLIQQWMTIAIKSQKDSRNFIYDVHNFDQDLLLDLKYNSDKDINKYKHVVNYKLLERIKSFDLDINMMASLAYNALTTGDIVTENKNMDNKLKVMPLIHCVDHHTYTQIAHFIDLSNEIKSYGKLFGKIWDEVVGYNPRFDTKNEYIFTKFYYDVRKAQQLIYDIKRNKEKHNLDQYITSNDKVTLKYGLTDDWLAGMIDPIEFRHKGKTTVVVVRTDDIYRMNVVVKPARDDKKVIELDEDVKYQIIEKAREVLSKGYKLRPLLPQFKNCEVILKNDSFYIKNNNTKTLEKWDKVKVLHYEFPNYAKQPSKELQKLSKINTINHIDLYTTAVNNTGSGLFCFDEKKLINDKIFEGLTPNIIRRILVYTDTTRSIIKLFQIGRDGEGVDYSVSLDDTFVNKFLCLLCIQYPAAIKIGPNGFIITCIPFMMMISQELKKRLKMPTEKVKNGWFFIKSDRKLWEHQQDSLDMMINRFNNGYRGSLIWIPVGLGKTLILISFISYLISKNKMPKYCVYTLPPSAIDSIKVELNGLLKYKVLDMRKTNKNKDMKIIEPYTICLIEHDHLRMAQSELGKIAVDMMFIVDEFHKTLNKTIRTSVALELTRLSRTFVGMSGTIIKDTNSKDLIEWLNQVVNFEVNENNYWVAIGALISKKVQTKVTVEREFINADLNRKINFGPSFDLKKEIDTDYKLTNKKLKEVIIEYVKKGEIVFANSRNLAAQDDLAKYLESKGIKVYKITKSTPITLLPEDIDQTDIQVVISTHKFVEGYQMTASRIAISEVIFSNQTTREQWEGRINRISQKSPWVKYITIHTGILTFIMEKYDKARKLSEALKGFADDINMDKKLVKNMMNLLL